MKILVLADTESLYLWDFFEKSKLEGIDLILSCGDLHPHYLSFLATFFQGPVLYVHGNHDDRYRTTPPEGCLCVEDTIYTYQGVRVLGLGGSARYKQHGEHQYTQRQMGRRAFRRKLDLFRQGGFDILLTHAPAYGLNDGDDLAHTGFDAFNTLMDRYSPKYFIHGHIHATYGSCFKRLDHYEETTVINAYEKYIIEYPDEN